MEVYTIIFESTSITIIKLFVSKYSPGRQEEDFQSRRQYRLFFLLHSHYPPSDRFSGLFLALKNNEESLFGQVILEEKL